MKLFAIYIGGEFKGAHIELHDMRFIIAEKIEDTYEELRRQWWGIPESLHLDCWAEVMYADGYSVTLKPEPSNAAHKLYYINLGGYDSEHFSELHKIFGAGLDKPHYIGLSNGKKTKQIKRLQAKQAFGNVCWRYSSPNSGGIGQNKPAFSDAILSKAA